MSAFVAFRNGWRLLAHVWMNECVCMWLMLPCNAQSAGNGSGDMTVEHTLEIGSARFVCVASPETGIRYLELFNFFV